MRILIGYLLIAYLPTTTLLAEEHMVLPVKTKGDDSISAGFGFYLQKDGADHTGGNPNLDEDELVYEGIILLDKSLSDQDRLSVKVLGDIVSSASQMRYHNPQFRALQSNPSGNKHFSGDFGYSHTFDNLTFGSHAGYSVEMHWFMSWLYGLNVRIPFNYDNTVMDFRLDGFTDFFQIKLYDGTTHGLTTRQTFSPEVSLSQVLTPFDLISLNVSYTAQFGTLETTYYSVFLNKQEQTEKMPGQRHRGSLTGRWKHSLSEYNALELNYRLYADTWRILSHTFEARFFQYLYKKNILLEPNLRLYTQSGAYFFRREFDSLPTFRTSDTDLGPFNGALIGSRLSFIDLPFFPEGINELSLGGNYWLRNDGMVIFWFDLGYLYRF